MIVLFYPIGFSLSMMDGFNICYPIAFALLTAKGLLEPNSARKVAITLRVFAIFSLFPLVPLMSVPEPEAGSTVGYVFFAVVNIGMLVLSWHMVKKAKLAKQAAILEQQARLEQQALLEQQARMEQEAAILERQAQQFFDAQMASMTKMLESLPNFPNTGSGSVKQKQEPSKPRVVQCKSCGANNSVKSDSPEACDYCGSPLER